MGRRKAEQRIRQGDSWGSPGSGRSDLSFHYSREERLSMAAAPKTPGAQGFLRRHRGLLIILADIAILLILGLVALRFFGPPASSARLGAYSASLRGLQYGEVVFATVTVRRVGADDRPEDRGERVYVRFALGRNAPESETFFDSAALPRLKGQEVVLQAALPFDEAGERVYAEVQVEERSARLSLPRSAW